MFSTSYNNRIQTIFLLIAGMISMHFNGCQAVEPENQKIASAFQVVFDKQIDDFLVRHNLKNTDLNAWIIDPNTSPDEIIKVAFDFELEIASIWSDPFFKKYLNDSLYKQIEAALSFNIDERKALFTQKFKDVIEKGSDYTRQQPLLEWLKDQINNAQTTLTIDAYDCLFTLGMVCAPEAVSKQFESLYDECINKRTELNKDPLNISFTTYLDNHTWGISKCGDLDPASIKKDTPRTHYMNTQMIDHFEQTFFIVPRFLLQVRRAQSAGGITEQVAKNFTEFLQAMGIYCKETQAAFAHYLDTQSTYGIPNGKSYKLRELLMYRQTDRTLINKLGSDLNTGIFDVKSAQHSDGYGYRSFVYLGANSGVLSTKYDDQELAKAMYQAAGEYLKYIETEIFKGHQAPRTLIVLEALVNKALSSNSYEPVTKLQWPDKELRSRGIDPISLQPQSGSSPSPLPGSGEEGEGQKKSSITTRNVLLAAGGLTLIGVTWHLLKNWRKQKAVIDQAIQEGKKLQTKLARKTIAQDEYDAALQELIHEYSKKVDKNKLTQALKKEGVLALNKGK